MTYSRYSRPYRTHYGREKKSGNFLPIFFFLFFLNLFANATILFVEQHFALTFSAVLYLIGFAVALATVEAFVIYLFQRCRCSPVAKTLLFVVTLVLVGLVVTDIFLLTQSRSVLCADTVERLTQCSWKDVKTFNHSHVTLPNSFLFCFLLLIIGLLAFLFGKLCNSGGKWIYIILLLMMAGAGFHWGYQKYTYKEVDNNVIRYAALLRLAYYSPDRQQEALDKVIYVQSDHDLTASFAEGSTPINNITVVIADSRNLSRCDLYSADSLGTNPLLCAHQHDSAFFLMHDAVASTTHDSKALFDLYALDPTAQGETPLFPMLFKKAGYRVVLLTKPSFNQQLPTSSFLANAALSKRCFNKRPEKDVKYDDEWLRCIRAYAGDTLNITVLHLGSFNCPESNPFPKRFAKFSKESYNASKYTEAQRTAMAHYDNTTYYYDYIVGKIIEKMQTQNSAVVYLANHGEEVYDYRDYMGHGKTFNAPDPSYQLRVPFMVWLSDSCRLTHPNLAARLQMAEDAPVITSDFPHFLLHLAGIRGTGFDESRSFFSPLYNRQKPRLCMGKIYCSKPVSE